MRCGDPVRGAADPALEAGGRSLSQAGILRQPYGGCRKVGNMDASEAINSLTNQVVAAVNGSHLHPAIVRLVLLNILHAVEDQERTMAQPEGGEANG